jgi:diaminopimelate epimerase
MNGGIKYEKYSGARNDFIIIDNRSWSNNIPLLQQEEFTKIVCSKMFTDIDGVIFADRPIDRRAAVRMNYYNRDGSFGAMCGNGSRCLAMFAYRNGIAYDSDFIMEAVDDFYRAEILDDVNVRVSFPEPKTVKVEFPIGLKLDGGTKLMNVSYIDVGSDHIVLFVDDEMNKQVLSVRTKDENPVNEFGRALRFHFEFAPRGANVNFVKVLSESEIRIRTYERGVERETLACGTGIVSSAIISSLKGLTKPPVKVQVKSGEWLIVDFVFGETSVKDLSLTGSAKKISEGTIE